MLGFNQCRKIWPDDKGVRTAVQAFFINDPYFPRPLCEDGVEKELWAAFVKAYLETGDVVMAKSMQMQKPWEGELDMSMPEKFIEACVEGKRRRIRVRATAEERLGRDEYWRMEWQVSPEGTLEILAKGYTKSGSLSQFVYFTEHCPIK
jgi:hypothetical protein